MLLKVKATVFNRVIKYLRLPEQFFYVTTSAFFSTQVVGKSLKPIRLCFHQPDVFGQIVCTSQCRKQSRFGSLRWTRGYNERITLGLAYTLHQELSVSSHLSGEGIQLIVSHLIELLKVRREK